MMKGWKFGRKGRFCIGAVFVECCFAPMSLLETTILHCGLARYSGNMHSEERQSNLIWHSTANTNLPQGEPNETNQSLAPLNPPLIPRVCAHMWNELVWLSIYTSTGTAVAYASTHTHNPPAIIRSFSSAPYPTQQNIRAHPLCDHIYGRVRHCIILLPYRVVLRRVILYDPDAMRCDSISLSPLPHIPSSFVH